MTYLQAYLFTRLDNINCILALILLVSGTIACMALWSYWDKSHDKYYRFDYAQHLKSKKILNISSKVFFIVLAIGFFIPSQKEAAFIYIAPKLINNVNFQETVKQIPELSNLGLQYLNDILKEKIKEEVSK